jgi:fumarylacetoacetate (FAA) hydrolase
MNRVMLRVHYKGSPMKLASLKHGRDGRLVVVSDDLAWCADATHIAPTLQAALDDWDRVETDLRNLATDLAHEVIPMMRFHERQAAAPLPRAFGRTGQILSPRDPIPAIDPAWGGGFEAGVVVVTGDVPMGVSAEEARAAIRLVGLCNGITLRNLPVEEARPASGFSPVFVTPDALGERWDGGKLSGVLCVDLGGASLARDDAGAAMDFDFGQLIAQAARARPLGAGWIVRGGGGAFTLKTGDTVRIWMDDDKHHPIFGVIEQTVG